MKSEAKGISHGPKCKSEVGEASKQEEVSQLP